MHTASMTNVLVRDLPDDVHHTLAERARAEGTSLQRYLTTELTRLARTPSLGEIIAGIERHSGGRVGFEQAVQDLEEERRPR